MGGRVFLEEGLDASMSCPGTLIITAGESRRIGAGLTKMPQIWVSNCEKLQASMNSVPNYVGRGDFIDKNFLPCHKHFNTEGAC